MVWTVQLIQNKVIEMLFIGHVFCAADFLFVSKSIT